MKTIGIKLADGSFYPILEEGTAKTYQLDLTTVKDDQTKVQIDLYRSENCTMDDAEYVDTLEVTNLVPHPNGEVELHLSVGLNENNELDAKVVDEETGKESETSVTLVSRTLAERAEPTNFELSEDLESAEEIPAEAEDFSLPEEAESVNEEEIVSAHSEDSLADFTFDDFTDDENEAPAQEQSDSEDVAEVVEEVPFSFDSEIAKMEEADGEEAAEVVEEAETVPEVEDFDIPAAVTADDAFDIPESEPAEEKDDLSEENLNYLSTESVEDFSAETVPDEAESLSNDDFSVDSLPNLDDDIFATDTTDTVEPGSESVNDDIFEEPENSSFDLPDFDTTPDSSTETAGLTGYFDDPAFKDDPVFTETNLDTGDNEIEFDTSDLDDSLHDNSSFAASPAMDFSDLYDKETLNGELSTYEEEDESHKTRIPVIICIICAIICILATALILFIVPSKYNLLNKTEKEETVTVVEQPAEVVKEEVVEAEPEAPAAPAAVEDKIVIAPEPEVVVPVPAPAPAPEKKKDIKYRIRWGDTLWDISEAYYKNPWRYPKIAKYNKIRNPDLIISGTDILIPQE